MSSEDPVIERFFLLAQEAQRVDAEALDEPVEPAFEAVLSLVISHPEARAGIARAFMRLAIDPNLAPPELIEFCMHALRWPEVKEGLLSRLSSESSERARHVIKKLIMSFDDDWYDAESYARFLNKSG